MQTTQMIINRIENWFEISDIELDPVLLSIKLLERLSTRQKIGLDYKFISLCARFNRNSLEFNEAINNAIVILLSRNLIIISEKDFSKKILITELGLQAITSYKEEMKLNDY